MKKWKKTTLQNIGLLCAAALLLTGCVSKADGKTPESPGQAQTAPAEPSPSAAEPVSLGYTEGKERILSALDDIVLPMEGYTLGKNEVLQEKVAQSRDEFAGIAEDWENILENTIQEIGESEEFSGIELETGIQVPSWQMLGVCAYVFENSQELFQEAMEVQVKKTARGLHVGISWPDLDTLAAGEENLMNAKFILPYMNTVYDEYGEETEFVQYPLSEEYLRTIGDPLPGTHIKNGWYNVRDKGSRKHTGTDIRAAEGTDILSCTDGTVTHIGRDKVAGNYVIVKDDAGFEYHYYHMVRMTDFLAPGDRVQRGDVVGHVGNTGNSVANHLHLAIVSPDLTYINPYPVLKEVREMQKEAK